MDNRAVTPVVGKILEVGVVVLFVALLTTILLGNVVPAYQHATDAELAERALTDAARGVETAIPSNASEISVRRTVDLPSTIGGSGYEIHVDGERLVLDHPSPAAEETARLALPPSVHRIDGRWQSGSPLVVSVTDTRDGLVVTLESGEQP
jgi:type II secretory pathway pseudopilin PulG